MDVCARTSAVSFCACGHASLQTRQRRRRAARGSSQYAADGARHTLRIDSSGTWKQRRWRRRMGRQGSSLRGPCVPSEGLVHLWDTSSFARHPLETRNCRHRTGKKREINLFVRLFGGVSVHLRGPGLVCLLFFSLCGGVAGSNPGAERLAGETGGEQAWLASTGAWLPSSAGASSSSPASSLCGGPSETR